MGRIKKAEQFYAAAEAIQASAEDEGDVGDAFVTLYVHAGIAAADAICCIVLGEHSQGDNHADAARLLKRVNPNGNELARALQTLLSFKTRAGYDDEPVNADMRKRARPAAHKLLSAARERT